MKFGGRCSRKRRERDTERAAPQEGPNAANAEHAEGANDGGGGVGAPEDRGGAVGGAQKPEDADEAAAAAAAAKVRLPRGA